MELKDFIANFIDQFDEAPETEVNPDMQFRDLAGWSSIIALSEMAMIEEEYGVQIKSAEMRKALTVQDLFDIVQSHANQE